MKVTHTHTLVAPKTQKAKDPRTIHEYIPNFPGFKPVLLLGQPWIWTRSTMASPGAEALNGKPPPALVSPMKSSDVTGGGTVTEHIKRARSHLPTHPKAFGHQVSIPTVNLLKAKLTL